LFGVIALAFIIHLGECLFVDVVFVVLVNFIVVDPAAFFCVGDVVVEIVPQLVFRVEPLWCFAVGEGFGFGGGLRIGEGEFPECRKVRVS